MLLHGNAVTGADYNTSGVAERLVGTYRVIIVDRPGFGHSDRPRDRTWTAAEQADLIHTALQRLGVGPAVVVGHSWGTLVALALAERHPAGVAGLVLLSGYYFPVPRLDALLVAPVAIPVLGDILRYTISPVFGWINMPLMKRAMFAPAPMTDRFKREYSTALALRPSQLRATASDGALMMSDAAGLSARYDALRMPVAIVHGNGDKVVSPDHAERLRVAVPGRHAADGRGRRAHGPPRRNRPSGGGHRRGRQESRTCPGEPNSRAPSGGRAFARRGVKARTAPINATEASARAALVASVAPDEIERREAPLGG